MKYKIEYLDDSYECDDCGGSYAEGYNIYKDNKLIIEKIPYAHCYNGVTYDTNQAYVDILEDMGIQLEEVYNYGS